MYEYPVDFKFQSYQSRQINPDLVRAMRSGALLLLFQSYQSRQINPDNNNQFSIHVTNATFQSYQSRQINPDVNGIHVHIQIRRVSIVSIQTDQSRQVELHYLYSLIGAVSIVSIQTDQSRRGVYQFEDGCYVSFNRINPDRSIPTF